jgi:DNA-binding transcriptional LysR family regulator
VDHEALRAFLAVVESGSFVSAATALRWSRASVRRRVDELEATVGVPLLVRTEQGASPTAAGEVLAARGRELLRESSALLASLRELGTRAASTIRVALPVGLPPRMLALAAATVRTSQPGLRLHVRVAEDPIALLLHDIDVAVSFGAPPAEGPWVSREIVRAPERLLASPRYLEARGVPERVEDLARHDLLLWSGPEVSIDTLPLRAGGSVGVAPVVVASDLHALRIMASEGAGILYSIDGGLPEGLGAGPELVPVLDRWIGRERSMRAVMPAAFSGVPRIFAAIDLLRSLARPAPLPPV